MTAVKNIEKELGSDTVNTVREVVERPFSLMECVRLKYKCFLYMAMAIMSSLLLFYSSTKEILKDNKTEKVLIDMIRLFSRMYANDTIPELSINTE